jgi:transcriptional antiterminator NusG
MKFILNNTTDTAEAVESTSTRGDWYLIRINSMKRKKIIHELQLDAKNLEDPEAFVCIEVPTEKILNPVTKNVTDRALYPDYLFVKADFTEEIHDLFCTTFQKLGMKFKGQTKMSKTEVQDFLNHLETADERSPKVNLTFDTGDTVKVTEGPFLNFQGTVKHLNIERKVAKVALSIFGRETVADIEITSLEAG